jgi:glutaredoxin/glutathione-dependent peroxiredoxin
MTITIGDTVPNVSLKHLTADGMKDLTTDSIFQNKKVMLFAVPGAFTPTCSNKHLPGFVARLAEFKTKNIDVVCLSVNDPFVMKAWQEAHNAQGITMLPDGNAVFTKALGLEMDGSGYGMGTRCQRFALYAENGVVKTLDVEKAGAFEVSSADACAMRVAA